MKLTDDQCYEFWSLNLSIYGMIRAIYEAGRQAALCEVMDYVKKEMLDDGTD